MISVGFVGEMHMRDLIKDSETAQYLREIKSSPADMQFELFILLLGYLKVSIFALNNSHHVKVYHALGRAIASKTDMAHKRLILLYMAAAGVIVFDFHNNFENLYLYFKFCDYIIEEIKTARDTGENVFDAVIDYMTLLYVTKNITHVSDSLEWMLRRKLAIF
jgi:hypothetical protein